MLRYSWPSLVTTLLICNLSLILGKGYECPYDMYGYVRFILYSRSLDNTVDLIPGDVKILRESGLNKQTETKLVTHGFTENPGLCVSTKTIIQQFKKHTDFNVILVDWSAVSGRDPKEYTQVVACVRASIAQYVGSFINFLADQGVPRDTLHLIGSGLGGQLIGITANYIYFKIPRMTALDPNGPLFDDEPAVGHKLDPQDAMTVDVLHSNAGVFGTKGPDGTIDFYLNGGSEQPQCKSKLDDDTDEALSSVNAVANRCNHDRAHQVFARSIDRANEFPSTGCNQVEDARKNRCYDYKRGYAGYYLQLTEPGIYYTSTLGYYFRY